jgi:hypothetical protein
MRLSGVSLFAAFSLAAGAAAQNDVLYYKFDAGGGTKVINYAAAPALAPTEGTITATNTQSFAAGRFGLASLKGAESAATHNFVDTGWNGAFSGSFTMAWFMKQQTPLPNTLAYYLFGGGTTFRVFTSGAAGSGLIVGGWGSSNLNLTTDIRTPAATRWVHVAIVVDATVMLATWYVDGAAQTPIPITQSPNVVAGANFRVGMHTRLTTGTFWDLDEVRFLNRAASTAEVLAWSMTTRAADGAYGKGCGATLASAGGPPALGNNTYRFTLTGAPSAPFILAIGASRLALGPVPLPFDLGALSPGLAGCNWETSTNLIFGGALDAGGNGTFPLGIPNDPALLGAAVYNQALVLGSPLQSSNPFAVSIGS